MSWFKKWPKRTNGRYAWPTFTEKQLNTIDSDHYVYNVVWSDHDKMFYLYRGYNLRNILWNHTNA